ncbi:hypothetical protein ACIGZJ_35455 [Kitasatospora sp. NPDC052868]|uniref:hypothetical protein n=1 Tax=Kitasatospora sp. NPDC052868 TaxID=3364060 RepID=UPI0037C6CCFF
MFASRRSTSRTWALASCVPVLLLLGLFAGGASSADGWPGTAGEPGGTALPGSATVGALGLPDLPLTSLGLAAERDGYRLDGADAELPAGRAVGYSFTITGPDGRPVTDFAVHQAKQLHFYAIRADLTGFRHLHPTMAADGTWTADLAALAPGHWRLYTSFVPNSGARKGGEIVVSREVTVPGEAAAVPLPAPAGTTTVDGYTVVLRSEPKAGALRLTATIGRDGRPVTDLQPYLDSYAHLTAFHEGDQALAHLHPMDQVGGAGGGPALEFYALLGRPGNWRLFLQFQTAGRLHTAELTLHVA